ncbi:MAG TPA: hypothetical protein VE525_02565 [Rubrobacter sp.]|nr:hypothetical protein [Rubrobacter sp.]
MAPIVPASNNGSMPMSANSVSLTLTLPTGIQDIDLSFIFTSCNDEVHKRVPLGRS